MKEMKFEEALGKLEEIVSELESGDLMLEESLTRFEEGIRLSRYCYERLEVAEKKIEKLVKGEKGKLSTVPFESGKKSSEDSQLPF